MEKDFSEQKKDSGQENTPSPEDVSKETPLQGDSSNQDSSSGSGKSPGEEETPSKKDPLLKYFAKGEKPSKETPAEEPKDEVPPEESSVKEEPSKQEEAPAEETPKQEDVIIEEPSEQEEISEESQDGSHVEEDAVQEKPILKESSDQIFYNYSILKNKYIHQKIRDFRNGSFHSSVRDAHPAGEYRLPDQLSYYQVYRTLITE